MRYVLDASLINVVVSRPRTGTTWLTVLLASYLAYTYHLDIEQPFDDLLSHCQVAFTHDPQRLDDVTSIATDYTGRRVVLLLRDPRDAITSAYAVEAQAQGVDVVDYATRTAKRFAAFYSEWLNVKNREDLRGFMTLTYEQMHAHTLAALLQVVSFFGYDLDFTNARRAVTFGSLAQMRKLQQAGRFKNRVRNGKVGNYHTVLNDAALNAITNAFGDLGILWNL